MATSPCAGRRHPEFRGPSAFGTRTTPSGSRAGSLPRVRSPIATSGTYERGAHIVDPFTAQPVAEWQRDLTGPDLTFADAYATAVFVMGEVGLEWLGSFPAYAGYVITHDGDALSTPNFAGR